MNQESHFVDDIGELAQRDGTKWSHFASGTLPAWIADMDVRPCPAVTAGLENLIRRGDFGYPHDDIESRIGDAFAGRMHDAFAWNVDVSRVHVLSDVIQGLCVAIETMTEPGAGVVIHTPAYPPFLSEVEAMGRRVVPSPLIGGSGGWEVDLEHLDRCCRDASVVLIANPHNPTGHVFGLDELRGIVEVAARHDAIIISDEIHAEMVWSGRHRPMETIAGAAERTVTLTSPTKAFNLAGARCAVAHVGSVDLQRRWSALHRGLLGQVSTFGAYAAIAAWTDGGPWLESTRRELADRRDQVGSYVRDHLPDIGYTPPEATYLAWLDLSRYGMDDPAAWLEQNAGLALGHGPDFGPEGRGWVRLNFATGRSVLAECLDRLRQGVSALERVTH